jgi:hypothetical protein
MNDSSKNLDKVILFLVVFSHHLYIVTILISIPFLIFNTSWYVSLPLLTWILYLGFSQILDCPWTNLENRYRSKIGIPTIDTFIKHYYVKPYKRLKIKRRTG